MQTINTKCGIYATEYTLIRHRDGSISVKTPYIKWKNNNGMLAFRNVKITKFIEQAIACFNDAEAEMTIGEIVNINDV
ncbi:hypothetical protein [Caudoviricetes sp.]|nr:hypothetical protein [Caudoviricetes sp.]